MTQDDILAKIALERMRQDAKWGVQDHPFHNADQIDFYRRVSEHSKMCCDNNAANGSITWRDILLEEFDEAFAETDIDEQQKELIQVAAVAVAIVECLEKKRNA